MSGTDRTLLNTSDFILTVWGLNPFKDGKLPKRGLILVCFMVVWTIPILIPLVRALTDTKADIWITLMSCLQCCIKGIVAIIKRASFFKTRKIMDSFWCHDRFGRAFREKLRTIEKAVLKVHMVYYVGGIASFLALMTKPLLARQRILPGERQNFCDIQASIICYATCYSIQAAVAVYVISIMATFDCMFLSFLAYGYLEMEQIKEGLLRLSINRNRIGDEPKVLEEISSLVEHHNRALTFISKIKEVYAEVLLCQFVISLVTVCMSEFCLIANGFPPPAHIAATYTPFLLFSNYQIFIYCTAGEIIAGQSESIAEATYASDWWVKNQPKTRKALGLIMVRAQKTYRISVGGMWELNMATLAAILKATTTMLAFMQAIYGR